MSSPFNGDYHYSESNFNGYKIFFQDTVNGENAGQNMQWAVDRTSKRWMGYSQEGNEDFHFEATVDPTGQRPVSGSFVHRTATGSRVYLDVPVCCIGASSSTGETSYPSPCPTDAPSMASTTTADPTTHPTNSPTPSPTGPSPTFSLASLANWPTKQPSDPYDPDPVDYISPDDENCNKLEFGACDCRPEAKALDLLLVLDVSSSTGQGLTDFADYIASHLTDGVFDENSAIRLGAVTFATDAATLFPIEDFNDDNRLPTRTEKATILKTHAYDEQSDATWTRRGLEWAWDEQMLPLLTKYQGNDRERKILLITDGCTSADQTPCIDGAKAPTLVDINNYQVEIHTITIGSLSTCYSFLDSQQCQCENFFKDFLDCTGTIIHKNFAGYSTELGKYVVQWALGPACEFSDSPWNGLYEYNPLVNNPGGEKVFTSHSEGFSIWWDHTNNKWNIRDDYNRNILGRFTESSASPSPRNRPESDLSWNDYDEFDTFRQTYHDQKICCTNRNSEAETPPTFAPTAYREPACYAIHVGCGCNVSEDDCIRKFSDLKYYDTVIKKWVGYWVVDESLPWYTDNPEYRDALPQYTGPYLNYDSDVAAGRRRLQGGGRGNIGGPNTGGAVARGRRRSLKTHPLPRDEFAMDEEGNCLNEDRRRRLQYDFYQQFQEPYYETSYSEVEFENSAYAWNFYDYENMDNEKNCSMRTNGGHQANPSSSRFNSIGLNEGAEMGERCLEPPSEPLEYCCLKKDGSRHNEWDRDANYDWNWVIQTLDNGDYGNPTTVDEIKYWVEYITERTYIDKQTEVSVLTYGCTKCGNVYTQYWAWNMPQNVEQVVTQGIRPITKQPFDVIPSSVENDVVSALDKAFNHMWEGVVGNNLKYNMLVVTSEPKETLCDGDQPSAEFQDTHGDFKDWDVRNRVWLFAETSVAETWKPYFTCFNKTYVGREDVPQIIADMSDDQDPVLPPETTTVSPIIDEYQDPLDPHCNQFMVGSCPCPLWMQKLDIVYLIDASNSVLDIVGESTQDNTAALVNEFLGGIADTVEHTYGDTNDVNIGAAMFATTPTSTVSILDTTSNIGGSVSKWKAEQIRSFSKSGGGTWTRRAIEYAWTYQYSHVDYEMYPDRNRFVLLITDGIPNEDQYPCDDDGIVGPNIGELIKHDVHIVPILIGDAANDPTTIERFQCLHPIVYQYTDLNWSAELANMLFYFSLAQCYQTQEGPFNGMYQYTGNDASGYKMFSNLEGTGSIYWSSSQSVWVFTDADGVNVMESTDSNAYTYRPLNSTSFIYKHEDDEFVQRTDELICCESTLYPTSMPTKRPTDNPTPYLKTACTSFQIQGTSGDFEDSFWFMTDELENGHPVFRSQNVQTDNDGKCYWSTDNVWRFEWDGSSAMQERVSRFSGPTGGLMSWDGESDEPEYNYPLHCIDSIYYDYVFAIDSSNDPTFEVRRDMAISIVEGLDDDNWDFFQFGLISLNRYPFGMYDFTQTQTKEAVTDAMKAMRNVDDNWQVSVMTAISQACHEMFHNAHDLNSHKVVYIILGDEVMDRPCFEGDALYIQDSDGNWAPVCSGVTFRYIFTGSDGVAMSNSDGFSCIDTKNKKVTTDPDITKIQIDGDLDNQPTAMPVVSRIDPIPESEYCDQFTVGQCPRPLGMDGMDLLYLVDGSVYETVQMDYLDLTEGIAASFDLYNQHSGTINYALITFEDMIYWSADWETGTNTKKHYIRNQFPWVTYSFQQTAMEAAKNMAMDLESTNTVKKIILVTENVATLAEQKLCNDDGTPTPIVEFLTTAGWDIYPVLLGHALENADHYSCLGEYNGDIAGFDNGAAMEHLYLDFVRPMYQSGPFQDVYQWDGTWEVVGGVVKKNFRGVDTTNVATFLDGVWTFSNSDASQFMIEKHASGQYRPPNGTDWSVGTPGNYIDQKDYMMCCSDTFAPTAVPTKSPTFHPAHPTPFESKMPTPGITLYQNVSSEHCDNFLVGSCPCPLEQLNLDVIYVLDSSATISAESWHQFTEDIGEQILEYVPDSARVGIVNYASLATIEQPLSFISTQQSVATKMRDLEQFPNSGTWTRRGLETAYYSMYLPDMMFNNPGLERTRYIVLVTDSDPSNHQSPCDVETGEVAPSLQHMLDAGIVVIPVAIKSDEADMNIATMSCLGDVVHYDDWHVGSELVTDIFYRSQKCQLRSEGPYNGGYSVSGMSNGHKTFKHANNWIIQWDLTQEGWIFLDPNDVLGPMAQYITKDGVRPPNGTDWSYTNPTNPTLVLYQDVMICCVETPTPTNSPTDSPTDKPTTSPTKNPSVTPTRNPTDGPTMFPTTSHPSLNPTTDSPTKHPTPGPSPEPSNIPTTCPTPLPTEMPSVPPTTEDPTIEPTFRPTTTEPTFNPTTAKPSNEPSKNPTTEEPTTNPSGNPTVSPSWNPTKGPIVSPSFSPSVCPTFNPTPIPTAQPSTCYSAAAAIEQECQDHVDSENARLEQSENDLAAITATEAQCSEQLEDVSLLVSVLMDQTVEDYQHAVTNGKLDCAHVPLVVCDRVTPCGTVNGACVPTVPTALPSQNPTGMPITCHETVAYWESAVTSGHLLCKYVPMEVCAYVTLCTNTAWGTCRNHALSGTTTTPTVYSHLGFNLIHSLNNAVYTGYLYMIVTRPDFNPITPDAQDVMEYTSVDDRVYCQAKWNTQDYVGDNSERTYESDCPLYGDCLYTLWLAADVDGNGEQITMIGAEEGVSWVLPPPTATYSVTDPTFEGFNALFQIVYPMKTGKVHWAAAEGSTPPDISEVTAGNIPCSGSQPMLDSLDPQTKHMDCILTPDVVYYLWLVFDADGTGQYAGYHDEDGYAFQANPPEIEFSVTEYSDEEFTVVYSVGNGVSNSGNVRFSAVPQGTTISDEDLHSGAAACTDTAIQIGQTTTTLTCDLSGGTTYEVYAALDIFGTPYRITGPELFTVNSASASVLLTDITATGTVATVNIANKDDDGCLYHVTTLADVSMTPEEIYNNQRSLCGASEFQANTMTINSDCGFDDGSDQKLWIVLDDDCHGTNLRFVVHSGGLAFTAKTFSPTQEPTTSPTTVPSLDPSTSPTTAPTKSPTTSPTTGPTPSPTNPPSTSPTTVPTKSPTTSPTTGPTPSPTLSPTTSPTTGPTKSPTTSPTTGPTPSPTLPPSTSPTTAPSPAPTPSPTKEPSTSPTTAPSKAPTVHVPEGNIVNINPISYQGFNFVYDITEPVVGGNLYWQVLRAGVAKTDDLATFAAASEPANTGDGDGNCAFRTQQTTNTLNNVLFNQCSMSGGHSYVLWGAADARGNAEFIDWFDEDGYNFAVPYPTSIRQVETDNRGVTTTGFDLEYLIDNPNQAGKYYWSVTETTVTKTAAQIVSETPTCGGSATQNAASTVVAVDCTFTAGVNYHVQIAYDLDSLGGEAQLHESGPLVLPVIQTPTVTGAVTATNAGFMEVTYNTADPVASGSIKYAACVDCASYTEAAAGGITGSADSMTTSDTVARLNADFSGSLTWKIFFRVEVNAENGVAAWTNDNALELSASVPVPTISLGSFSAISDSQVTVALTITNPSYHSKAYTRFIDEDLNQLCDATSDVAPAASLRDTDNWPTTNTVTLNLDCTLSQDVSYQLQAYADVINNDGLSNTVTSAAFAIPICQVYKFDTDKTWKEWAIDGAESGIHYTEGVYAIQSGPYNYYSPSSYNRVYNAAGDRSLVWNEALKSWVLTEPNTWSFTSNEDALTNQGVTSGIDWAWASLSSSATIAPLPVTASCTTIPPYTTKRDTRAASISLYMFILTAFKAYKSQVNDNQPPIFPDGVYKGVEPWEYFGEELLSDLTPTGVDPGQTLANFIQLASKAEMNPACRPLYEGLTNDANPGELQESALQTQLYSVAVNVPDCMDNFDHINDLRLWRDDPDDSNWGLCAGTSDFSDRGPRCALWQAIHGLSVHVPSDWGPGTATLMIKDMLVTYYGKYLGESGRATIQTAYDNTADFGVGDDDISYTWRVHNTWNSAASGAEALSVYAGPRDPWYPKIQWPDESACTNCKTDTDTLKSYMQSYYALSTTSDGDIDTALAAFVTN